MRSLYCEITFHSDIVVFLISVMSPVDRPCMFRTKSLLVKDTEGIFT